MNVSPQADAPGEGYAASTADMREKVKIGEAVTATSATGLLGLEATLGQLVNQQLNMIALNLDDAFLQRPARAAAAFQRAGELLELALRQGHATDGRHRLATSALALAAHPRNAVAFGQDALFADATAQRLTALGTMPAGIGGIDQPAKAGQGSGFLRHTNLTRQSGSAWQSRSAG